MEEGVEAVGRGGVSIQVGCALTPLCLLDGEMPGAETPSGALDEVAAA